MNSLRSLVTTSTGPVLGAWIKLGSEETCEIVAGSGVDFLVIDLEHSQLSIESAYRLLATASLAQVTAFVRTPEINRVAYQKLLDAGANGILAPQLEDVSEVRECMSFCMYPPEGVRGFSTTTRAGEWGRRSLVGHIEMSNSSVTFIPQLESRAALDRLVEIVDVDGLAAVFIGMTDLAVSMGLAPDDPVVRDLVSHATATCHHNNILIGTALQVVEGTDLHWYQNFDFLLVGDDASLLASSARKLVNTARSLLEETG